MGSTSIAATRQGTPARWLIAYLAEQGIEVSEICRENALDETALISDSGIIRTPVYLEVFNWAAKRLNRPLLGAEIAEAVNLGEFGIVGHLVMNGPSLRESFRFLERYHSIFSPDFEYRFTYQNGKAHCRYTEADIPGADSSQDINFGLGLIISGIRERVGPSWRPLMTCFNYEPPEDSSSFTGYFGEAVYFEQPQNLIEFEEAVVDIPNDNADINLLPILLNQANTLLDEQQTHTDIVRQVRLLVTTSVGYRTISAEAVATRLNVSVRQLQRLLEAKGTSFRQIKDDTLTRIAKDALLNSDLSITEIAMKLCYSETSAFDRMFKKKAGLSPLQYRKKYSL